MEDSIDSVGVTQDPNSGNVTVKLDGSDQPAVTNVSGVTVSTPGWAATPSRSIRA